MQTGSRSQRSRTVKRFAAKRRVRAAIKSKAVGRGIRRCWVRIAPRNAEWVSVRKRYCRRIDPFEFILQWTRGPGASAHGVLAGYPMVDFQVALYDGSYHSVDSQAAFKMAGIQGVQRSCLRSASPPPGSLDEIEVTTPTVCCDGWCDLSSRRGHIWGRIRSRGFSRVPRLCRRRSYTYTRRNCIRRPTDTATSLSGSRATADSRRGGAARDQRDKGREGSGWLNDTCPPWVPPIRLHFAGAATTLFHVHDIHKKITSSCCSPRRMILGCATAQPSRSRLR